MFKIFTQSNLIMRRLCCLLALIGFSLGTEALAATTSVSALVDVRVLIIPRSGLSPANLGKIVALHGGRSNRIGRSDVHVVYLPHGTSAASVVEKLKRNPQIKSVEVDRLVKSTFVPNDPYLGSEYHVAKVGAPNAWNTTQGAGVIIGILDSGVDTSHPDLMPNLLPGFNFVDNNTNTSDVCGHGTAVAGTAAAVSNNGIGVAGIAGQAKILPIRIAFFDATANSCYAYLSTVVSGINYAADNGARVVNVSYSGIINSPAVQNAANYAKSKGALVFVSAGNNGIDEGFAPTTTMIPVSATDGNDVKTSWSSYGNFVALAAPGAGIWTTSRGGIYQAWNGTSFASPLAAGVAALVMSANRNLDNLAIESTLYASAVDLGPAGRDTYYGYGRVDAAAAVASAVARTVVIDTVPPTSTITAPSANATVSGLVPVDVTATDNIAVNRVELKVNSTVVGVATLAPFVFSWDSAGAANGMSTLVAVAYDAAGNFKASAPVAVNVVNSTPVATVIWTTCANEGGTCNFSGTRNVRYGANNSYATLSATASIACNNIVFGDPMPGVVKTCQYADTSSMVPAPAPSTWTACANEGGTCNFSGTSDVRYGANSIYSTRTASGSIACTNTVFGDPIPGVVKACEYATNLSTPPVTAPVVETWTACGSEGATCSFAGTREVRYGANGVLTSKIIAGSTSCTNSVFGDPIPGVLKSCSFSSITR